ncbi:MAG: hypothetical protein IRY99_16640 [Isosphaeraceae bacterium]|nr:hypothetical protein [Isosphaeraceae bacterium]
MARFILRYRGQGPKPPEDVERLCRQGNATILDDSSPRMVLVEAPEDKLRSAVDQEPDWVISHERTYSIPSPFPSLDKAKDLKEPD